MTDTDLEDMKVFILFCFFTFTDWTLQEIFRSMDSDGSGTINIKVSPVVVIFHNKIKMLFCLPYQELVDFLEAIGDGEVDRKQVLFSYFI